MSKWLNNKHIFHKPEDIEKPCIKLNFCPYGQLVEEFPLERGEYGCKIFGHDCPVYYHAEGFSEKELLEGKDG